MVHDMYHIQFFTITVSASTWTTWTQMKNECQQQQQQQTGVMLSLIESGGIGFWDVEFPSMFFFFFQHNLVKNEWRLQTAGMKKKNTFVREKVFARLNRNLILLFSHSILCYSVSQEWSLWHKYCMNPALKKKKKPTLTESPLLFSQVWVLTRVLLLGLLCPVWPVCATELISKPDRRTFLSRWYQLSPHSHTAPATF